MLSTCFKNVFERSKVHEIPERKDSTVRLVSPIDTLETRLHKVRLYDDIPFSTVLEDISQKLTKICNVHVPLEELNETPLEDDIVVCMASSEYLQHAPKKVKTLVKELLNVNVTNAAFVYHCSCEGPAWIIAKNVSGMRYAVYRYLHFLGARWLAPHPDWEVLPTLDNVHPIKSALFIPEFEFFGYAGNGGLGNPTWPPLDWEAKTKSYWNDWKVQNSNPSEWIGAAGHYGEHFNFIKQCHLRNDRTHLAWRLGGRGIDLYGKPFPSECFPPGTITFAKLHYTYHGDGSGTYDTPPDPPWADAPRWPPMDCNPASGLSCSNDLPPQDPDLDIQDDPYPEIYKGFGGIISLFGNLVKDELVWHISQYGDSNPLCKAPSVEPSDGGGHCECTKCRDLLRNGPYDNWLSDEQKIQDANDSDKVHHLANEVAKYLVHWFGDKGVNTKHVSLLAYDKHWAPPSIPIEKNTLVQVVPLAGDTHQNYTEREILEKWSTKRKINPFGDFKLTFTKQWLLSNYVFDLPQLSPRTMIHEFMDGIDLDYAGMNMQTTFGHGPMGLTLWLIGQIIWNKNTNLESLIDEWFELSFGHIKEPVKRMFERWWQWYELTSHETSVTLQDLMEAQRILNTSPDSKIQKRLDHIKLYAIYLYKRCKYIEALNVVNKKLTSETLANFDAVTEDFLTHLWKAFHSNVIHSYRIHTKIVLLCPQDSNIPSNWDIRNPNAPRWSTIKIPDSDEINTTVLECFNESPPLKFVHRRMFSNDLVPMTLSSNHDYVDSIIFTLSAKFQMLKGNEDALVDIKTFGLRLDNVNAPIRIIVRNKNNNVIYESDSDFELHNWVSHIHTISGPPGLYDIDIQTRDPSQYWKISVPKNIHFINCDMKGATNGWNQTNHMYFFVPKNTRRIALAYKTRMPDNVSFFLPDGSLTLTQKHGDLLYYADVPKDYDDKIWSFTGMYSNDSWSRPRFENCPNNISYSREQLLIPRECLEAI